MAQIEGSPKISPRLVGGILAADRTGVDRETRVLATSPHALRRRFPEAFDVRPAIYWVDLLASSGVGWTAFAVACVSPAASLIGLVALVVAVLALYRSVLFIHELAHLRRGALPGFEAAWHLLAGLPLMATSLLYVGSHGDHHRAAIYGTKLDPEYEAMAYWSPLRILLTTLGLVAAPAVLILRWTVLGPVSRLVPPLRKLVVERLSTLVINPDYRRREPRGRQARRWAIQEATAAIVGWLGVVGLVSGAIPLRWFALWYAMTCSILLLNQLRTLAAHRHLNPGGSIDAVEQLRDSINLVGAPWLLALAAPVGLRFHALHHLAPTLPYHSLGAVHRRLVAELPDDSPYRTSESRGMLPAVAQLLRPAVALSAGSPDGSDGTAPANPEGTGVGAGGR